MTRLPVRRGISALLIILITGCGANSSGPAAGPSGSDPASDNPTAAPDVATVATNSGSTLIDVLQNDSATAGDRLTISAASVTRTVPSGQPGSVSIASGGSALAFQPPADFSGTQIIVYSISDESGGAATSVVAVTVSPVGVPPTAVPDVATAITDSAGQLIDVLANDFDGSGDGLTLIDVQSIVTVPSGQNGTAAIVDGQIAYIPAPGFIGSESLSYTMADASGRTATTVVVVTVLPAATPPLPAPDVFTVAADSSNNVLDVLANDIDLSGSGLSITAVASISSLPLGNTGSYAIIGNEVVYAPTPGFVGAEYAQYTVRSTDGASATGTFAIVVGTPDVELPPVAVPDVYSVSLDSTDNLLDVLANDVDPTAGGLTITSAISTATVPAGSVGTVILSGNAISYTPAAGFIGAETLSYEILDSNGTTTTGAVIVSVLPTDPPPIAVADVAAVEQDTTNNPIDVLANDFDLSGTGLTITSIASISTLPAGNPGSFSISGGLVNYSPAPGLLGVETAVYTVTTGAGITAEGTLNIAITATLSPESPPVAVPDAITINQNATTILTNAVANDIDPSGNGLTIIDVQQALSVPAASHTFGLSGNQVAFAPAADFVGVVTLTYTISDGVNNAIGTIAITVSPDELPLNPVALPDAYVIDQAAGSQLLDVISNDVSPTGAALSLTSVNLTESLPNAAHAISISGNQLQFAAPSDFAGVVVIGYTISDGSNTADGLATFTVNPLPLSALPLGLPDVDTASSTIASPQSYDVLANDIDPAAGGLTLTGASITASVALDLLVTDPGTVSIAGNQVVYTPTPAFAGTVTISYTAEDVDGQALTSALTLTVTPL